MDTGILHSKPLAELHAHLTTSIPPHVFWHIAQSEGYKLPKRDYKEFENYIVLSPERKLTLREYLDEIYHPILDKLSSGARALEKGVYEGLGGAYRSNNITLLELRTNPLKHNREGEVDLDHAIMAMLRGMERALLEYPKLKAGLIFCLDRQFSYEKNKIIVEKAVKYHRRGVIAIDFANYNTRLFHFRDYTDLISYARQHGLKVTAHSGETEDTNDMWDCLEHAKPDRIGHGIKAAYDKELMKELVKRDITLEVCPLGNLMTKAVENDDEMKFIIRTLLENGVKFTINTDWPETVANAHLSDQIQYLREKNILTEEEIDRTIRWAFDASFINLPNPHDNLYL
ncbi:MAG: adenosine deaminase [Patescibacteria group bacterium]|nr:adenosine deaminase [Patescibacteria group bacterium]